MSQPRQGVMIAIDWENIRRGVQLYQRSVKPAQVCQAMHDVGGIFGEVGGGKAFGDWSLRPDDGREFAEHDIIPYHAPRTIAGKDRSDPAILLEVYEWIRDRDGCGTVLLGSGDADYQVWWTGPGPTGNVSCCAPSASRFHGTCWPPCRCFPWKPNWASRRRSTGTSMWMSPPRLRRPTMREATGSWNVSRDRCTSWKTA